MELPSSIYIQPHSKKEVVVFFGFSSVHFDDGQMVVRDHAPTTSLYTDPYHWQMLEVVGRVFQFVAPQTVKATQKPLGQW